jgi:L-rhamnose-H+ transport protein
LGLCVCVVGIIISGKAGMMKDKELEAEASETNHIKEKTEYKFGLGLLVAIISGVLSA